MVAGDLTMILFIAFLLISMVHISINKIHLLIGKELFGTVGNMALILKTQK